MNGKIVNGSPIKVTLARRQMMSASVESESPGDWACIGLYFCDLLNSVDWFLCFAAIGTHS